MFSQVDQYSYFESQLNMVVRLSRLLELFIIPSVFVSSYRQSTNMRHQPAKQNDPVTAKQKDAYP